MVRLLIEPGVSVPVSHALVGVQARIIRHDLHRDIASLLYVCGTRTYGVESGPKDRSLQQCHHGT
jgi:hypothetical protein